MAKVRQAATKDPGGGDRETPNPVPPDHLARTWAARDQQLEAGAANLRLIERNGELPAGSPTVVAVQGVAQALRDQAARDPLLADSGIVIPPKVTVHVLSTERLIMSGAAGGSDEVFISIGALKLLGSHEACATALALVQAQWILKQVLAARAALREGVPESRCGERIHQVPVDESSIPAHQSQWNAVNILWADHGNWIVSRGICAYLAAAGYDLSRCPAHIKMLEQIAEAAVSVKIVDEAATGVSSDNNENHSDDDGAFQLDNFPSRGIREFARAAEEAILDLPGPAYLRRLAGATPPPSHGPILAPEPQADRAATIAAQVIHGTALVPLLYAAETVEVDHGKAVFSMPALLVEQGRVLSTEFVAWLATQDRPEQLRVLASVDQLLSLIEIVANRESNGFNAPQGGTEIVRCQSEHLAAKANINGTFSRLYKAAFRDAQIGASDDAAVRRSVEHLVKFLRERVNEELAPLDLTKLERLLLGFPKSEMTGEVVIPLGLKAASVLEVADALAPAPLGSYSLVETIELLLPGATFQGVETKVTMAEVDTRVSAIAGKKVVLNYVDAMAHKGVQLRDGLGERVADFLMTWITEAAKKGEFESIQACAQWLVRLKEVCDAKTQSYGALVSSELVADLAFTYAAVSSTPPSLAGRLKELTKSAIPGTQATKQTSKDYLAKALREAPDQLASLMALGQWSPQRLDHVIAALRASNRERVGSASRDEILNLVENPFTHPVGLHDTRALEKPKNLDPGKPEELDLIGTPLRKEYQRGKRESFAKFLARIESLPHRLSAVVWGRIAQQSVRTLADLQTLQKLVAQSYEPRGSSPVPRLTQERAHALAFVAQMGIEALREEAVLKADDPKIRLSVLGVIRNIPRTPTRNKLVFDWAEQCVSETTLRRDELLELAGLVETEPASELVNDTMRILMHGHEPRLLELEGWLAGDGVYVAASMLDRDRVSAAGAAAVLEKAVRDPTPSKNTKLLVSKEAPPWIASAGGFSTKLIEPTAARHEALVFLETESPAGPVRPLPIKPEPVKYAEQLALRVYRELRLPMASKSAPLQSSSPIAEGDVRAYLNDVVLTVEPVPTPQRDRNLLALAQAAQGKGLAFSVELLLDLSRLSTLPDTREHFGFMAWNLIRDRSETISAGALQGVLSTVDSFFPAPSAAKNRVLRGVRIQCEILTLEDARRISDRLKIAGGADRIPEPKHGAAHISVEVYLRILKTFNPFDQVESLLYMLGMEGKKPWSPRYRERLLGVNLDSLAKLNQELDSGSRREFIEMLFGGPDGIFASEDGAALRRLSKSIANRLQNALPGDAAHNRRLARLCNEVVLDAGLPIADRVNLVCTLLTWFDRTERGSLGPAEQAELYRDIFDSFGSYGRRVFQRLLQQPGAFPADLLPHLLRAKFSVEANDPVLTFDTLSANGTPVTMVGRWIGRGTIGEIVADADRPAELHKVLDHGCLIQNRLRRQGFLKIARALKDEGAGGWGETMLAAVLDSCDTEARELGGEADITGEPMARMIANALGGTIVGKPEDAGPSIVELPSDSPPSKILVPKRTSMPHADSGQALLAFRMTTLEGYQSIASIDSARGEKPLALAVAEKGGDLPQLSERMVRLFLRGFMDGKLMKDPQAGNVGLCTHHGETCDAMVDFGSVTFQFPEQWRNWMLRVVVHVQTQDIEELKNDLVELAMASGRPTPEVKQIVATLDERVAGFVTRFGEADNMMSLVGEVVEVLYNEWPLQPDVRDFCEAIRAVSKEWIPHLSPDQLQSIGSDLLINDIAPLIMTSGDALAMHPTTRDAVEGLRGLRKDPSPDEAWARLQDQPIDEYFEDELNREIPAGAVFIRVQGGVCEPAQALSTSWEPAKGTLNFGRNSLTISGKTEGYFVVREDGGKAHYFSLKALRAAD